MLARLAKRGYVAAIRIVRVPLRLLGILGWLEKHRDNRAVLWFRSLFAIYDFDDLVSLDLPWWTFDSITMIDKYLQANAAARVFEFGSGASTVWLSKRAGEVHSVEHDVDWLAMVRSKLSEVGNVHLHGIEVTGIASDDAIRSAKDGWTDFDFRPYVQALADVGGEFDLIIIDGRARSHCMDAARGYLSPTGIILFDNSHRSRYRQSIEQSGLERIETKGLTSCLPTPDATTLLARDRSTLQALH